MIVNARAHLRQNYYVFVAFVLSIVEVTYDAGQRAILDGNQWSAWKQQNIFTHHFSFFPKTIVLIFVGGNEQSPTWIAHMHGWIAQRTNANDRVRFTGIVCAPHALIWRHSLKNAPLQQQWLHNIRWIEAGQPVADRNDTLLREARLAFGRQLSRPNALIEFDRMGELDQTCSKEIALFYRFSELPLDFDWLRTNVVDWPIVIFRRWVIQWMHDFLGNV